MNRHYRPVTKAQREAIRRILRGEPIPPMTCEPKPRPPAAFGYRRCSHQDSADTRLGLDVQTRAVEAWYQVIQAEHPEVAWGQFYEDTAVSAHKKHFFDWPEGRKLNAQLRKGDHVIFAKFDRAFRNLRDCLDTLATWDSRGITVHFADLKVDRSTTLGRFMVQIIAACAELEAANTSERNKAVAAELKRQGRPVSKWAPPGFRIVGEKGHRYYVPLPGWDWRTERSIRQEIVKLKDQHAMTFRQVSDAIEGRLAAAENRTPHSIFNPKRKYSLRWIKLAYKQEKALQAFEVLSVKQRNSLQLQTTGRKV